MVLGFLNFFLAVAYAYRHKRRKNKGRVRILLNTSSCRQFRGFAGA
jgi:hypothetical protein